MLVQIAPNINLNPEHVLDVVAINDYVRVRTTDKREFHITPNPGETLDGAQARLVGFINMQYDTLVAERDHYRLALEEVVFTCRTKQSMKQRAREALFDT